MLRVRRDRINRQAFNYYLRGRWVLTSAPTYLIVRWRRKTIIFYLDLATGDLGLMVNGRNVRRS